MSQEWGWWLAAALVGYLVGAVNPAMLIARARGVDLRSVGSGNPGATNATRAMGTRVGVVVGVLDVVKGLLPAALFALAVSTAAGDIAGLAAVLGHVTSPFLRGKGGKGVATALGALLGVHPSWALLVLVGFGLGYLVTRRIGMGAVVGAAVLVVVTVLLAEVWADWLLGFGIAAVVLVRHQHNVEAWVRTLRGR